jgi:hypothetical protein
MLSISPNIARSIHALTPKITTIPMSVRRVIRRDLIQPNTLQRDVKKKKAIMAPMIIATTGLRKSEKIQIETDKTMAAMRVFAILFPTDTGSSLRYAKKTNKIPKD